MRRCLSSAAAVDPALATARAGLLQLYGAPTSRVNKVAWAAAEAGVPLTRIDPRPASALNAEAWYTQLNPKGTVPSLRDGDLVLNESNSAVAYVCRKYGHPSSLHPQDEAAAALAWQWLEFGETTLAPAQSPLFFGAVRGQRWPKAPGAPPPGREEMAQWVPQCVRAFRILEGHLADGRPFVLGERFSMADITVGVQAARLVECGGFGFEELDAEAELPALHAWYTGRIRGRRAFVEQVLPHAGS